MKSLQEQFENLSFEMSRYEAYFLGREALSLEDNPYVSADKELEAAWLKGFEEAETQRYKDKLTEKCLTLLEAFRDISDIITRSTNEDKGNSREDG